MRVRASRSEGGLVLTFDDITRLVSAQRNAAWRDVARRMAHEIKNPLTPIQLSAERLQRETRRAVPAEDLEIFDRCTNTIVRQVGDIGRMVEQLFAFARMPSPEFAEQDLVELLRAGVFAQRVASPDIEIELLEPLLPHDIDGGRPHAGPRPDQYPQERRRGGDRPRGRQAQAEGQDYRRADLRPVRAFA